MSQLPGKYKGATEGPWVQQGFYGTTDHLRVDGADGRFVALVRADHVETRSALNGKTETDYVRSSEQFANEKLIIDAPMLACHVVVLESVVEKLLGIVESEYEADPEPEDLPSWKAAIEEGHKALTASPFGIAAGPMNDTQQPTQLDKAATQSDAAIAERIRDEACSVEYTCGNAGDDFMEDWSVRIDHAKAAAIIHARTADLQAERDRYWKALTVIGEEESCSPGYAGQVMNMKACAREALEPTPARAPQDTAEGV